MDNEKTNEDQRVCEIEMRLAFQEEHLQEISALVAQQARDIDVLQKQLSHAYKKIKAIDGNQNQSSEFDDLPPPHY